MRTSRLPLPCAARCVFLRSASWRPVAVLLAAGASAFGIDTDQPPPPGVVGTPYSFTFVLKAGAPPYAVLGGRRGDLAPGLKIESDGTMHGTPTAPGTFDFTVEAPSAARRTQVLTQWGFTHKVRDRLAITTPSLPSAVVGTPYTAPVSVVGNGKLGMGWTVSAGALPAGLTLAPDGSPGDTHDLGHAGDGRHVDVHRQGRRYRRVPARPLDDEAVHARRRRAAPAAPARTSSHRHRRRGRISATPATATGGLAPYTWGVSGGTIPPGWRSIRHGRARRQAHDGRLILALARRRTRAAVRHGRRHDHGRAGRWTS